MRLAIAGIVITLYLWIGYSIFRLSVKQIGGKEKYLRYMMEDQGFGAGEVRVIYIFAGAAVMFGWPLFLVDAIMKYKREDK